MASLTVSPRRAWRNAFLTYIQHIKNERWIYPCTPPSSVETFRGKISALIGSSKEIAGLNKKKKKKKKKNIMMMMMTRNS